MYVNNFNNSFDTWNLRNNAEFETMIARDIYWIPLNSLGKTKYTNQDIKEIGYLSIEKQQRYVSNLYETVQLFQNIDFEICSDKPYFLTPDGLKWQYQYSPKKVCQNRRGSCCEIAIWLDSYASCFFDESGYIMIQRPQNGHVMNYFRNGNNYYFVDLETYHSRYIDNALEETGVRKDYFSTKFFTNAVFRSSSIQNYISYYEKISALAKMQFAFYRMPGGAIPPVACEVNESGKKVFLSKEYDFEILNNAKKIETIYVDYNPKLLKY